MTSPQCFAIAEAASGKRLYSPMKSELKVSTRKLQLLAWACVAFFTFCTIMSWRAGQGHVSPWFVLFILLAVPVLLFTGPITFSPEMLKVTAPVGRFEVRWRDIDRIETGQSSIVFFAGEARIGIPTPNWWAGPNRETLWKMIETLVRERQLEMRYAFRADFLFPKRAQGSSVGLMHCRGELLADVDLPRRFLGKPGLSEILIRKRSSGDTVHFTWISQTEAVCRVAAKPRGRPQETQFDLKQALDVPGLGGAPWYAEGSDVLIEIRTDSHFWAALKCCLNHLGVYSLEEVSVQSNVCQGVDI